MSRRRLWAIALGAALCLLLAVPGALLWARAEATQPAWTHFPLPNGRQQALLACSAGYALIVRDESPLSVVEQEAQQAARVDARFAPLVSAAASGLRTAASRSDFQSFCLEQHLWP